MVTRLDADVGRLLALLKELKIDDDTLVMFSSDNGPQGADEGGYDQSLFASNGGLRGLKRDLYEGGVRVPMIARWPGRVPAGRASAQIWTLCDFLPTAAALAGAETPNGIDGLSMLPALVGGRAPARAHVYWEFHEGGFAQAVRVGHWKAVRRPPAYALELYDLQIDPRESRDVAAAHPAVAARAAGIMRREHAESEHWPVTDPFAARLLR
jgi:arylsulfatase A-like enzyme